MGLLRVLPILLVAAAIPLFRQLLFGAVPLDDDVFVQDLPAMEWLARSLRSGDSILWSPQMLGGFPLAFTQYPFFYPPDLLLYLVLSPPRAYAWSQFVHLLLSGVLTYLYCRTIGLRLGPSLLAALSFQMSSEVVAGMSGHAAHGMFALPGGLLGVELALRAGWQGAPPLALVVAAGLLIAHPQIAMLSLGPGALYALFRLAQLARAKGVAGAAVPAGWLALAGAVGLGMAAVRMLPLWDMVGVSTRAAGLPSEAALGGAVTPLGLVVGYLLPLTHLQTLPWGAPSYAGPAVLVLALIGLRRVSLHPLGWFFLGLAALTLLLALGEATPLHLLTRLPLLSFFRGPSRFAAISTFAIAILGAMALDSFSRSSPGVGRNRWRHLALATAAAGSLALAFFGLGVIFQLGSGPLVDGFRAWCQSNSLDSLNPLRPRMGLPALGLPLVLMALTLAAAGRLSRARLEASLVAIAFLVLLPVGIALNPTIDPSVWARVPSAVGSLQSQGGQYRVFSHVPGMHLYNYMKDYGPGPEAGFADDLRYRYQAELVAPILNLRWGITSLDGYENFHSLHQEVMLRYTMSQFLSRWIEDDLRWARLSLRERLRVLGALNVRYLLSAVDLTAEAPELKPVARWQLDPGPLGRATPSMFLMEYPAALPRYYLVQHARPITEGSALQQDGEALHLVARGEVDPATVVLLHETAAALPNSPEVAPPTDGGSWQRSVEVLSARNASVELVVSTDRPAYLVTSDSYWPGWRAFVDGKETPVLRANATGRAVWLGEGGTHRVIFRFEPASFSAGLAVSIAAALVCAVWMGAAVVWRLARGRIRPTARTVS